MMMRTEPSAFSLHAVRLTGEKVLACSPTPKKVAVTAVRIQQQIGDQS